FGRYRPAAFDGCKSLKVADTARNRGWLGKLKASPGGTGYPVIQLMTLCETGTRALIGAVFGTTAEGETTWARKLLHLLDETMLVLMDRGFAAGKFLAGAAAPRAQFLVRLPSARRPPLLRDLPDGSFLSLTGGVKVRIITATVTVTCHDGTTYGDSYRLAATLLDHRAWPAHALIALYHERWEHEITYLALRRTLLNGRVLRSGDPAGLEQEMRALPARCQALRIAITDAVATIAGTDPRRPPAGGGPRPPQRRPRRHRPGRRHRPRRPGQPAPATAAPRLRPPRQVPAIALEQEAARQTRPQP